MKRRPVLRWLAGGAALAAAGGAWTFLRPERNSYYSGPVSSHFDGIRFFNPGHPGPRGGLDLLRWQIQGDRADWPTSDPSPFRDRPPGRVEGSGLRITFVGHATFLIQTAGLNILCDPVWSDRASPVSFAGPRRVNDPGIQFGDLPPIDVILLSHNHYDHLDLSTLEQLDAAHRPLVITPLGNDAIIEPRMPGSRVVTGDWCDVVDVGGGVRVHLEQALHWSARNMTDRSHALWAAFVVEGPAGRVYVVGDTGFGDGETFRTVGRRHPDIRVALLPIGAYEPRWFMQGQHMNPDEAVQALELCGAAAAIAHHWGTFQLTDEAIRRPVEDLEAALAARGGDPGRFPVLRPGQVWEE